MTRPPDLPDFEAPPVVEVTLGLQFATLRALRAAHLGLLWVRLREAYPRLEEHGLLGPAIEHFGGRPPFEFQLEIADTPPPPRAWFLAPQGDALLQVQQDRFIENWRKTTDRPYPRYEPLRAEFLNAFQIFSDFVSDESLGEIEVLQGEINYVNHIVSEDPQEPLTLQEILSAWDPSGREVLSAPEQTRLEERHIIERAGEEPVRLYLSAEPGPRAPDGRQGILLTLTVRGAPTAEGFLPLFDLGREVIVRAFTAATTSTMHQLWRRTQ